MDFREYIAHLKEKGLLKIIDKPLSVKYDIPFIMKKYDGIPILFENPIMEDGRKSEMKIIGNIMSSPELFAGSIGIKKTEWIRTMNDALKRKGELIEVPNILHYIGADLDRIPFLTHYENDPGPYITSDVTVADRNGRKNASVHRMLKLGKDRIVIRMVERHLYEMSKESGWNMPITISIGNRPSVLIAASTSIGPERFELEYASALERKPIEFSIGKNGIPFPADAEIVIEGMITAEEADEGPFVDLTETDDHVRKQHVFKVTNVGLKKDAIYHALLPGANEHKLLMGQPRTPMIYDFVKNAGFRPVDVFLTPGGSGWLSAVVSIEKKRESDGVNAAYAAISGHYSLREVTIVDKDIDVSNPHQVEWARIMFCKEIINTPVMTGSSLHPFANADTAINKFIVDATRPVEINIPKGKEGKFKKPGIPKSERVDGI